MLSATAKQGRRSKRVSPTRNRQKPAGSPNILKAKTYVSCLEKGGGAAQASAGKMPINNAITESDKIDMQP
jgi:hypothetical protein